MASNNFASKFSTGLSGATAIGTNVLQMSKARGLNNQQLGYLQDMNTVGQSGYGSYGQALNDYQRLNFNPSLSFDQVRGMTTGQKLGNVFTDTMTGATTGLAVAGPWGALGGAILGAGAGAYSWVTGDNDARNLIRNYKIDTRLASTVGKTNADSSMEDFNNADLYSRIPTLQKMGGKIERKAMTIQEFADRVMKRQKSNSVTRSAGVQRIRKDGGVCIRIKR